MNVFKSLAVLPVSEDFVGDVEQHRHLEKIAGVKPAKPFTVTYSDAEESLLLDSQAQAEGWHSHWHKWLEESCQEDSKHNPEI